MDKNIDFVAYFPQKMSIWRFVVAGKARQLSEVYDETLAVSKTVLDACEGFFIPTEADYSLRIYPEDMPANGYYLQHIQPLHLERKDIQLKNGIVYTDLIKDIQSAETGKDIVKNIGQLRFLAGKTKFILKANEKYLDRHSELYLTWDYDEVSSEPPSDDPILLEIQQSMSKDRGESVTITDHAYYDIVFRTFTDIWFENTEIGVLNRDRLRHVFKTILEKYEVVDTSFFSDWFSEEKLKNIAFIDQ